MTREYADICLRALMNDLANGNDLGLYQLTLDPQGIWVTGVVLDQQNGYWRLNLVLSDGEERTGSFSYRLGRVDEPDPPADAQSIQFTMEEFFENASRINRDRIFAA